MDSTKRYPFIPDTRVHSIQAGTKMPEKRRYFLLSVLFVLLLSLSTFRAEAAGKKITITTKIDPKVLAGIKVELDGKQLDGTVSGRLQGIQRKLDEVVM